MFDNTRLEQNLKLIKWTVLVWIIKQILVDKTFTVDITNCCGVRRLRTDRKIVNK